MTTRRGKTAGIPFRQERRPLSLCRLAGPGDLQDAAVSVAERVQSIGRHRSCCAYVFVRAGMVYVVSEESAVAHSWAVQHFAEWVGCYGGLVDVAVLVRDLGCML